MPGITKSTDSLTDNRPQTLLAPHPTPTFQQMLELAAVELERRHGTGAPEELWNMNADAQGRALLHQDYDQAVADHLQHQDGGHNPPVAERMALLFELRQADDPERIPPGWSWPVCDDCTTVAYDMGQTSAIAQAAFMQEFGLDVHDHLCEMALPPEDQGRESCACGCQNRK